MGEQKGVFTPNLIIEGTCPGCPPESTPMTARNQGGLQTMIHRLNTVSNEHGLKITDSINKTKVLKVSKRKGNAVLAMIE